MNDPVLTPGVPEPKSKSTKGNVPAADIDLVTTAKSVAEKWRSTPALLLNWTNADRLNQITTQYEQILNARIAEGSRRPEVTKKLKNLDKQINAGTVYIKDYLKELYGSDDKSHYSQYGIVSSGKSYKIQADRDARVSALSLILEALERDGLNDKTYGKTYWQDIQSQYIPLKQEAAVLDESVSGKVGEKNILKEEIVKHLYALINLLKANYPETYKAEMRVWGFQKEKY